METSIVFVPDVRSVLKILGQEQADGFWHCATSRLSSTEHENSDTPLGVPYTHPIHVLNGIWETLHVSKQKCEFAVGGTPVTQ